MTAVTDDLTDGGLTLCAPGFFYLTLVLLSVKPAPLECSELPFPVGHVRTCMLASWLADSQLLS